ncbi:MAG: hypothetical protein WKF96_04720 [Solirubrobacteraceae bacterium]
MGRLREERRLPRTLTVEQVRAVITGQERYRDRFLFGLLALTGMRVGQALGLRHCDFVTQERRIEIVPREGNANHSPPGAGCGARLRALCPQSAAAPARGDQRHRAVGLGYLAGRPGRPRRALGPSARAPDLLRRHRAGVASRTGEALGAVAALGGHDVTGGDRQDSRCCAAPGPLA